MEMNNRRAFIIGLKSTNLTKNEIKFLKKYRPWGVILFTRNIKNINQTKKLTSNIRKIYNDKNYPILIDQEGGRVSRLENIITFRKLSSEFFGKEYLFYLYYFLLIKIHFLILKKNLYHFLSN